MIYNFEIEDAEVLEQNVAEDVTEIVENNMQKYIDSHPDTYLPDIDYSDIGWLLEGSKYEAYKNEIAEW